MKTSKTASAIYVCGWERPKGLFLLREKILKRKKMTADRQYLKKSHRLRLNHEFLEAIWL